MNNKICHTPDTEKPNNTINRNTQEETYVKVSEILNDDEKSECYQKLLNAGTPIVLGPSSGIGGAFFKLLKEKNKNVIGLGTRQKSEAIKNELSKGNPDGLYFLGDLFCEKREDNEAIEALLSPATANAYGFHLYNAATNMDQMAELDENGNVIDERGNIITADDENYKDHLDAINPQTMKRWDTNILSEEKDRIRNIEAKKQIQLFHDYLENILTNRNLENKKTLTIIYIGSIANMFGIAGSTYGDFKKACSELCEEYRIKFALKFGDNKVNIIDLSLALVNTTMGNQRTHLLETTGKIVDVKGKLLPVCGEKINQKGMFEPEDIARFLSGIMESKPGELSSRMLIHSSDSIDINKQKKQHEKDMQYVQRQYQEITLDYDDEKKIILNEKALNFLLGLRQYKLDKYYNNYEKLYGNQHTKPKIIGLKKNITKGKEIFKVLSKNYESLPEQIFLDQAMRFLNNHI